MKLEYSNKENLKQFIRGVVKKYLPDENYKVFFFGSRVRGDNFPRSDIDIGIEGPVPLTVKTKFDLEDALDDFPTLYKFDLVDFTAIDQDFRQEAKKYIEYIRD